MSAIEKSRDQQRREQLAVLRSRLAGLPGIKDFHRESGAKGSRAFWNQLKVELMRLSPDELPGFLQRHSDPQAANPSRLAEVKGLAVKILEYLPRDHEARRLEQEALIHFCLEKEAAWRLDRIPENGQEIRDRKKTLKKALALWEVP